MKVYKGTDKDMKCRGFQYELGVTVKSDDAIRCGNKGFHSCEAPFDVLRYYPNKNGNRFFEATADGKIDRTGADDSKIASSEITLDKEISFDELCTAQIEYTRTKAESGECGGDYSNHAVGSGSNLICGNWSNLAGGYVSNLLGGYGSTISGGDRSNIKGGNWSAIAGVNGSNLLGGDKSAISGIYRSNIKGGRGCNIAGSGGSNLFGGDRCNIAGGDDSNLSGGDGCLVVGRNGCSAKAGVNSVIVLTEWERIGNEYKPVSVKAEIVDGERIKPDTWYKLIDGEFVEDE